MPIPIIPPPIERKPDLLDGLVKNVPAVKHGKRIKPTPPPVTHVSEGKYCWEIPAFYVSVFLMVVAFYFDYKENTTMSDEIKIGKTTFDDMEVKKTQVKPKQKLQKTDTPLSDMDIFALQAYQTDIMRQFGTGRIDQADYDAEYQRIEKAKTAAHEKLKNKRKPTT